MIEKQINWNVGIDKLPNGNFRVNMPDMFGNANGNYAMLSWPVMQEYTGELGIIRILKASRQMRNAKFLYENEVI